MAEVSMASTREMGLVKRAGKSVGGEGIVAKVNDGDFLNVKTKIGEAGKVEKGGSGVKGQAKKMLTELGLLPPEGRLAVREKGENKTAMVTLKDKAGKKISEVPFSQILNRYEKESYQAAEERIKQREELEYLIAKHDGKKLEESKLKLVIPKDPLSEGKAQIWESMGRKTQVREVSLNELTREYTGKKLGIAQSIRNLTKVYGSRTKAIEKYISRTALGRAAEQAFTGRTKKLEMGERKLEAARRLTPGERRTVWKEMKVGMMALRQGVDRPLSYLGAVSKAATGLMLYDANPLRLMHKAAGKPIEKLWTKEWGKSKVSLRELAARLEEKLLIDPITGKGVRTGAITGERIREASVAGAAWGVKMHLLPELLAQLPVLKAINLNPGEIYSTMRSSKMLKGGVGSVSKFVEMWKGRKTAGEKAKVAAWVLSSGVGFYLAEKLSPNLMGAINPVLMGDIWLMRLVGEVQKYQGEKSLQTTELTHTLEMVETGITGAFALDSAISVGNRLYTYSELGAMEPRALIKDETSLVKMVAEHPEYLRGEGGGVFGQWQRAEHEVLTKIKGGGEKGTDRWQHFTLPGTDGGMGIYHLDAGEQGEEAVLVRQNEDGSLAEWDGKVWVEVEVETVTEEGAPESAETEVNEVEIAASQLAVHDYIYFAPDSSKIVLRLDLVPGESWESKVNRLFLGYQAGGIDDPREAEQLTGEEVKGLPEGGEKLTALSGQDGVYERQVYNGLVVRLLSDAAANGLRYDVGLVKQRMVEYLQADLTADADTLEAELDYGELYRYLFVGSEVLPDQPMGDELPAYFLNGQEGTERGAEFRLTIPSGSSFSAQLASYGYGYGDGKIYDAKSELVEGATIYRIGENGEEAKIEDFEELNLVRPGEQFVVRLGRGKAATMELSEMPATKALFEGGLASWELPVTAPDKEVLRQEWEREVVRNEAGEILVGIVPEGGTFSELFGGRMGHLMSVYEFLPRWQEELVAAGRIQLYKERQNPDGSILRVRFEQYDELNVVAPGDRIVIVDSEKLLSQIPDQTLTASEVGEAVIEFEAESRQGIDEEGLLIPHDPPQELIKDTLGRLYLGEVSEGVYLSRLVAERLGSVEEEPWQRVLAAYQAGKIEFLRLNEQGELVGLEDINQVQIGEKLFLWDKENVLSGLPVAEKSDGKESHESPEIPDSLIPEDEEGLLVEEAVPQDVAEPGHLGKYDLNSLPTEPERNSDGYIYLGKVTEGDVLSTFIGKSMPSVPDAWSMVYRGFLAGVLGLYTLDESGAVVELRDINSLLVGDHIVVRDRFGELVEIPDYEAPYARIVVEEERAVSEEWGVASIQTNLSELVSREEASVRMVMIDPDNPDNTIEVGATEHEQFSSENLEKLAIAMLIYREAELGKLDLRDLASFTELPGEYVPTVEQAARLMLTYGSTEARLSLVRELSGNNLSEAEAKEYLANQLSVEWGLDESEIINGSVSAEGMLTVLKSLIRTNYLTPEHRGSVLEALGTGGAHAREWGTGMWEEDLAVYPELSVLELTSVRFDEIDGSRSEIFQTLALVQGEEGQDVLVLMEAGANSALAAQSTTKTVARQVAREVFGLDMTGRGIELSADIGMHVEGSKQATQDYLNHLIHPYQNAQGNLSGNPVLLAQVLEPEKLSWEELENEVKMYPDGSALIHLTDPVSGRVITIATENNNQIEYVIDSAKWAEKNISYEVYDSPLGENVKGKERETGGMELTMQILSGEGYSLASAESRQELIDKYARRGQGYDYFVFPRAGAEGDTVIVDARGERIDGSALLSQVRIGVVEAPGVTAQINDIGLRTLVDELTRRRALDTLVWRDAGTARTWDQASGLEIFHRDVMKSDEGVSGLNIAAEAWEGLSVLTPDERGEKIQASWTDRQREVISQEYAEEKMFLEVLGDTFGKEYSLVTQDVYEESLAQELWGKYERGESLTLDRVTVIKAMGIAQDALVVDGVRIMEARMLPSGFQLDWAVIARSLGIEAENLAILNTSDSSVVLLGERLMPGDSLGTYRYGNNNLLYQYKDGSLSENLAYDPNNPLAAVLPLERPLESYGQSSKLVPLPREVGVKLQYLEEPYYVESNAGDERLQAYVNPYNLKSYVMVGESFFPLVSDSYNYQELREIYKEQLTVTQLWERRIYDELTDELRGAEVSGQWTNGKLQLNNSALLNGERYLEGLRDEQGNLQFDPEGRLLLKGETGRQYTLVEGSLKESVGVQTRSFMEVAKGYQVASVDGDGLQAQGMPLLTRDGLLYQWSSEGIKLVGSWYEPSVSGWIKDAEVGQLAREWGLSLTEVKIGERDYRTMESEPERWIHSVAVSNDLLLEVEGGVVDAETGMSYKPALQAGEMMVEEGSGRMLWRSESGEGAVVWTGERWLNVAEAKWQSKTEYSQAQGWGEAKYTTGKSEYHLVERRTELPVYEKEGMLFVLDGLEARRIGEKEAMLSLGMVGYLEEERYQSVGDEPGKDDPLVEKIGKMIDPYLNSFVRMKTGVWGVESGIEDVFARLERVDGLSYDELPPQYVQALISQEQKRLFRYDEGEALNLNLTVLGQVLLSGGQRGGSTLVQGLVKNVLMSPEERMGRDISRKTEEIAIAVKVIEELPVEKIVELYANSIGYGSVEGAQIMGSGRAAEALFGKTLSELSLTEIGLLVVVPNHPARYNLYSFENAESWADAASGVYYHMWENGFLTEAELKAEYLSAHERTMPMGSNGEIEMLIDSGILGESERSWAEQVLEEYRQLDFEGRKIKEVVTELRPKPIELQNKPIVTEVSPLVTPTPEFTATPSVEEVTETIFEYADFFEFLHSRGAEKLSESDLSEAYEQYYQYGKLPGGEGVKWENSPGAVEVGEAFTVREFNPSDPDYTPRVMIDEATGEVKVDPWSYRYEAISSTFNVISEQVSQPVVQDDQGALWEVTPAGLRPLPGQIFQTTEGQSVQAEWVSSRPGMVEAADGRELAGSKLAKDLWGNYYQVGDSGQAELLGRGMESEDGMVIVYPAPRVSETEIAGNWQDVALTALRNAREIFGETDGERVWKPLPESEDPSVGLRKPQKEGELGLINPDGLATYLESEGMNTSAIELVSNAGGAGVYRELLNEMSKEGKPTLIWINDRLTTDVVEVKTGEEEEHLDSVAKGERPVTLLSVFTHDGKDYVAYQDPLRQLPVTVPWEQFEEMSAPKRVGRFKILILDEYQLDADDERYRYEVNAPVHQVELLLGTGYTYDYENPSEREAMMTINPAMQQRVSELGAERVLSTQAGGFVGIAMDQQGNIPFFVNLDAEGKPNDPRNAYQVYEPGSVFKLVTAMWAQHQGVSPNQLLKAGDFYEWGPGARTYNWTIDASTGQRVAGGAKPKMDMEEALARSNNPYFLNLAMGGGNPESLAEYAQAVGFGHGEDQVVGLPSWESSVPNPGDPDLAPHDYGLMAIGQGPLLMSPTEMLRFVGGLANDGVVVEPSLVRGNRDAKPVLLPNDEVDFEEIKKGMEMAVMTPAGTGYTAFKGIKDYTVYGKTGTAEDGGGGEPHSWFVGWAQHNQTGERLSFVFVFPNAGEGSAISAPIAREALDTYFANVSAHRALQGPGETAAGVGESVPVREDLDELFAGRGGEGGVLSVKELEYGLAGFEVEAQPNYELLRFVTEATRIAGSYEPSEPDLSRYNEAAEFVEYLENQLKAAGFEEIISRQEMRSAFSHLRDNYLLPDHQDKDPYEEPIQCVGWEGFIGMTTGILEGAPLPGLRESGNAASVAASYLNKETGEPTGVGGMWRVFRFEDDKSDIAELSPGDAFYIRYPAAGEGVGHTGVILATGISENGERMVLVADSNRRVDEFGTLITDGKPRLTWMNQIEFSQQFENSFPGHQQKYGNSRFVVARPVNAVESVYDPDYRPEQIPDREGGESSAQVQEGEFQQQEDGYLTWSQENSVNFLPENLGEMRPIESIMIHWSGATGVKSEDWTAEMVRHGLIGEKTSSTFAVGVDGVLQLAKLTPSEVQETYASPWRHGAINIEIAGENFDETPPPPEEYKHAVELVTELLISTNKSLSIVRPHYKEVYLWSENMPNGKGKGEWILIDSREIDEPERTKYWDGESESWKKLSEFPYKWDKSTLQSKQDPGEEFFAQLLADVGQRLHELGRDDLRGMPEQQAMSPNEIAMRERK